MWVVVAAGNDPDNDVAALTRGNLHTCDVGQDDVGYEGECRGGAQGPPREDRHSRAVLDAKIVHLPITAALALARRFADDALSSEMKQANLSLHVQMGDKDRLKNTDIQRAFLNERGGPRTRGRKPGTNTVDAFESLQRLRREGTNC